MRETDVARVGVIRRTPEVARWWRVQDDDYIGAKLDSTLLCWVVELYAEVIGFAQAYEEVDPEYRHAGLDLFLHPDHHGRGLGRDVVRTVARHLLDARSHHRLVIDPAAANEAAIRCYEAVGFRKVGILRSYWWDHVDNCWADGMLLDLLRGELL